jgi:hypothetical protein
MAKNRFSLFRRMPVCSRRMPDGEKPVSTFSPHAGLFPSHAWWRKTGFHFFAACSKEPPAGLAKNHLEELSS